MVAQRGQTRTTGPGQNGAQTGPNSIETCHFLHIWNKSPRQQNPEILPRVEIYAFFGITNPFVVFEINYTSERAFLNILKVIWGNAMINYFPCTFSNTLGLLKINDFPFIFLDIPCLSQDTTVLTLKQIPRTFKWMEHLFWFEFTFRYLL